MTQRYLFLSAKTFLVMSILLSFLSFLSFSSSSSFLSFSLMSSFLPMSTFSSFLLMSSSTSSSMSSSRVFFFLFYDSWRNKSVKYIPSAASGYDNRGTVDKYCEEDVTHVNLFVLRRQLCAIKIQTTDDVYCRVSYSKIRSSASPVVGLI